MPTYAELHQKHPTYSLALASKCRALYGDNGLFAIHLNEFLPQRPAEPASRWEMRRREAGYRNYIGPIVDFFTSMLFATRPVPKAKSAETGDDELEPDGYYTRLVDDCDRRGRNIDDLLRERLTDAMIVGSSWVRIHEPTGAIGADSRAEYSAEKLGECWLEALSGDEVFDWEGRDGALEFMLIHSADSSRFSVSEKRGMITESWHALYPDRVETYAVSYDSAKGKPAENQDIPLVETTFHGFGRVPAVRLILPSSLHVASRLMSPQLSHFRKSNALAWSLSSTAYAQPVFKVRDAESLGQSTGGAGYGIILGIDEDAAWMAPPTGHFQSLADEVACEKDEIFRVANQLSLGVENNAAAIGRSGESKIQDSQNTKVSLLSFSRAVKEFAKCIFDTIAERRGDGLVFDIGGLDDFAAADVGSMLANLKLVQDIGGIPSNKFKTETLRRLADAILTDASQVLRAEIASEIEDGVEEAESAERDLIEIARGAAETGPPGDDKTGGPPDSATQIQGQAHPKKPFGGSKKGRAFG